MDCGQPQNASQTWDAVRRSGIPDYQRRLSARARASVSGGPRRQCVCREVGRRKRQAMERGRVAAGGRRRFGGRQFDGGDGHVDCGGEIFKREANPGAIEGMVKAYAGKGYPANLEDPRVSPLRAVKPGALPPSFIICGTADTLLPETHSMAAALKRADIRHEVSILEEMPHGFLQMDVLSGCKQGLDQMFDFLRRTI